MIKLTIRNFTKVNHDTGNCYMPNPKQAEYDNSLIQVFAA